MFELHNLPIDLGTNTSITNIRVYGIGKINGRAAPGQLPHLAGWRTRTNVRFKELTLQLFHELRRIFNLLKRLHQLLNVFEEPGIVF